MGFTVTKHLNKKSSASTFDKTFSTEIRGNGSALLDNIYGAVSAGSQLAMVLKPDPSYSLIDFTEEDKQLEGAQSGTIHMSTQR